MKNDFIPNRSKSLVKRIIKYVFIPFCLLALIIGLSAGFSAYSIISLNKKMSAYHYKIDLPGSIDKIEPVLIGGIDQWISIRGNDESAPILLFIHGGPGFPMIRIEHEIASEWEEYFTVVFWDQRGSGKSYYPSQDIGETMTVDQMIDDASEMVEYLRSRFKRDKIFVMGHSWGSVLGIHMAKRHPQWLYAYIGAAQVVNSMESKEKTRNDLLTMAKEYKDVKTVENLSAMSSFTNKELPIKSYYSQWGQVQHLLTPYGGDLFYQKRNPDLVQLFLLSVLLRSHTSSLKELYREVFSSDKPSKLPLLREGVRETNIPKQLGFDFEIPIFFALGAHDLQVHHMMSAEYFEQINAPHKEIIYFNNSAHMMISDEPGRFLEFLITKVLPISSQQNIK